MEPSKGLVYKVGVFVVLATFLTVGFILALGGDKSFFQSFYTLKMEVDETGGLTKGSIVQIAGIQAGHVDQIEFEPKSTRVNIFLKLEKRFMPRITKGSVAGMRTQGALGDRYVLIHPGSPAGEPIPDGSVIDTEVDSDIISTLGKSGPRLSKVFDILDSLEKMVNGLQQRGFAQNLSDAGKNMKNASQTLDDVLTAVKTKKAAEHFASILEKIDSGQGTLGGLINDPTVHEDMKTILGGAKRSKILKYLIRQTLKKGEEGEAEEEKSNKK